MSLRDHFRPPLSVRNSWEGFHGGWPMVIVQELRKLLPKGYFSEPHVHLGSQVEVDIATFEQVSAYLGGRTDANDGDVAVATWAPAEPTVAIETDLEDTDEYEVRIYDIRGEKQLVAAIEIVSPANQDRPSHRTQFISKCISLLKSQVAVSLIDLVTTKHFNLYTELLATLGQSDPTFTESEESLDAVSCRWTRKGSKNLLESWSNRLKIGEPLPIIPIWLQPNLAIPLNLETAYEKACYDLAIIDQ